MTKRERYHHVAEGEWVVLKRRKWRHQCCECAVVHDIDLRLNAFNQVEARFRINRRATAAARRMFKFTTTENSDG